jgi:hypothetical protein
MWAFRRWSLQKMYSIDEYIQLQTNLLFQGIKDPGRVSEKA